MELFRNSPEYALPQPPHYSKHYEHTRKDNIDSLENLLTEKLQCLSDILGQISHDIESRRDLSLSVIDHVDTHYCYIKSTLLTLDNWTPETNKDVENRRSGLEKRLDNLNHEKRQEQIQSWQDIQTLKKELRTWFKQFSDLLLRAKLINPTSQPTRNPLVAPSKNNEPNQTPQELE